MFKRIFVNAHRTLKNAQGVRGRGAKQGGKGGNRVQSWQRIGPIVLMSLWLLLLLLLFFFLLLFEICKQFDAN